MAQFKKIYSEYKHKVYFFVRKYVQRDEDVEDIMQDIFMHVWKHTHKTTDSSAIEAIIFKTSKQEVANFYRKNKMVLISSDQNEIPDTEDEILEEAFMEEQISKIEALLDRLPEKTKELFIQHKIEKLSYSHLAKENKISKVAIGKHINKAISFLKINLH
ncbi:RNA polymerase sigma factor [Chryseobacterium rhizosphaerae]|uniref:RNA polymerase sigma-70 factor (ECF subfamily) n=1 Tax=Chryseobacterium rhizosphaerae TaxID=395937 RepID=A0AAE3YDM1_9FLAO|nr:sigma-70 family RNA polymerase sigma factor [Chryseobacterium rhizosphaerae]MDC8099687.1 sigma-70 family RNA polymerase sigma factor [Chryseobacterium rhizosphaerae]MDR6528592.1 RNA polymerase sigma-70 factor (ECF subfamily) [Chryseobacterium rhizosphaerae]